MKLSEHVFSVDKVLSGVIPVGDDQCRFDYNQLESALKAIVRRKLGDDNAMMADVSEQTLCQPTFVVATRGYNADGPPYLFRSYKCPGSNPDKCAIWEAGRATSAAPTFFKPMFIPIPSPGFYYVDGGVLNNNPSQIALDEAGKIWPDVSHFCLVSIGAGRQRSVKIVEASSGGGMMSDISAWIPGVGTASQVLAGVKALTKIMNACVDLAANSESCHQRIFRSAISNHIDKNFPYYRFNVERDMEGVGFEEWRKRIEMNEYTARYMEEGEGQMRRDRCVQTLMEDVDIEAKDQQGNTSLLWAANKGDERAVQLLLEMGADVGAKENSNGLTALHMAAAYGHERIVRLLLKMGADVIEKDNHGGTALIKAAACGHERIVYLLLEKGSDVEEKNNSNVTPLTWAADQGHEAVVRLLLEKGAKMNEKSRIGGTALRAAARTGNEGILRLLLEKGAHVDVMDSKGYTPLMVAIINGQEAVVPLLLEKGAEVDHRGNDGTTALAEAAVRGYETAARLLLEKGASVKLRFQKASGTVQTTVLHLAAHRGHQGVVRLLLGKGREVDPLNSFGEIPLYLATLNGHESVVRYLLENGANVRFVFRNATTMLHVAASGGHEGIIRLLLDNGADLSPKDSSGATAVVLATKHGHTAVVRILQDYAKQKTTWYGRRRR